MENKNQGIRNIKFPENAKKYIYSLEDFIELKFPVYLLVRKR